MACPHCNFQERFETKDSFPYITEVIDGILVISKNRNPFEKILRRLQGYRYSYCAPKPLFCNDIKYCPMCGQKLSEVKSIGRSHIVDSGRNYKTVHAGGCMLNTYIEYEDENVKDGNE